jgi:hypothetical protein
MRSPYAAAMYLCQFYLMGMLRAKQHSNNPCTKDELNETIQNIVFSTSKAEF